MTTMTLMLILTIVIVWVKDIQHTTKAVPRAAADLVGQLKM